EGGVRVPFFVYWKDKIKAGENDHLCALYDVLATAADLAGVMPPKTDGISFAQTLLARTDEQLSHEYLYWENGTYSPHAQSVRMNQWWAYREHPSKPVMLYDISQDIDCRNDVAKDHPDLINRIKQIFTEAHTDSEWYVNPGESKTQIAAKRKKAFASGGMQRPTGANTTYRGRTEPSPAGDVLKAAPDSAR
ncbi:MAG: sulfatase, partial [Akkermansiaceae bacterium]